MSVCSVWKGVGGNVRWPLPQPMVGKNRIAGGGEAGIETTEVSVSKPPTPLPPCHYPIHSGYRAGSPRKGEARPDMGPGEGGKKKASALTMVEEGIETLTL